MLIKSETHASYYEEQFYYNIDLETGKELTLLDLLGPDFKAIVNQSVKDQMKQRMQADPDAYYFEDDLAFTTISDDQGFYVNEAGHVVVVFPKYEVAPGYIPLVASRSSIFMLPALRSIVDCLKGGVHLPSSVMNSSLCEGKYVSYPFLLQNS